MFDLQLSDDAGSLFGESPYIGKGLFQQNEYALEHHARAKSSEVQHGAVISSAPSSAAVSELHATMSQGQLDFNSVNNGGEALETFTIEDKRDQIGIDLQDRLHALAEGWLWL